jgi:hypothetical protein
MENNIKPENTDNNTNDAYQNFSNFQSCRIEPHNKSTWIIYSFDNPGNADKFFNMRSLQLEGTNNIKVQVHPKDKSKIFEYRL